MRRSTVCLSFAMLLEPVPAGAQVNPQIPTSITATIERSTAAAETGVFEGELAASASIEGDVEVDPSRAGAALPLRPASFTVRGRQGAALALVLPGADECTLTAPGATLAVNRFRVSVAGGRPSADPEGLALDARGFQNFKIGATLHVAAGQPRLRYVGHFPVTLAYN